MQVTTDMQLYLYPTLSKPWPWPWPVLTRTDIDPPNIWFQAAAIARLLGREEAAEGAETVAEMNAALEVRNLSFRITHGKSRTNVCARASMRARQRSIVTSSLKIPRTAVHSHRATRHKRPRISRHCVLESFHSILKSLISASPRLTNLCHLRHSPGRL